MDRETDSTLPLVEQFRFDAGSAALDLLSTLGFRGGDPVERLTSADRVRDWLACCGLPAVAVREGDLESVRELREHAYAVLAAVVAGTRPPTRAVAGLSRWAERPLPGTGLRVRSAALDARPPRPTLESLLTGLARDLVATALEQGNYLRMCSAPTCHMLYLDTSRGRRRQWCSMARCGNQAKAARHRQRSAS